MTKRNIRIAQAVIAGIFVIAVAYFIVGIVLYRTTGPEKAQERFSHFMEQTSNLAATYEPNSAEFNGSFTPTIDTLGEFQSLSLTLNGAVIYRYPPAENADTNDGTAKDFYDTTRTLLGNTLAVNASLYTLNPSSLYRYAKVSFLLILLGTLAAVVLLIVIQLTWGKRAQKTVLRDIPLTTHEEEPTEDEEIFSTDEPLAEEEPTRPYEELTESAETAADDEAAAENTDEEDFDPIGELEHENKDAAGDDSEDSISFVDETLDSQPNPIHAQLSIEAELAQDLRAASEDDTDISVVILRFQHFREGSATADTIGSMLLERVGHQGTVFSYNDGYALIIRNTNLDTALATAQSLYTSIDQTLSAAGEQGEKAIGISARTGRTLSAKRLITEAEQACLHADGENPIIAFRVNPERYREYMQTRA